MRTLVYSINNIHSPHFETELEIMKDHLDNLDEVYVVACNKQLSACYSNQAHREKTCSQCKRRLHSGLDKVEISRANVICLPKPTTYDTPRVFDDVKHLMSYERDGVDFGLGVASTMISELRDHDFDTKKYRQQIYKNLQSSIHIYHSIQKILAEVAPDCLYVFNGRFSDTRPAVRAAEALGIDYWCHERGGNLKTYSLYKNCFPHSIENAKHEIDEAWHRPEDCDKEAIGMRWFNERVHGVMQSWSSFITEQEKGCLPVCFDTTKRNVAIFNSSLDEYESIPEWKNPIYENENAALERILASCHNDQDIIFHLRVHPNLKGLTNTQIRLLQQISMKYVANLKVIWPEEKIDSYALMHACEKTVSFISTMGVEASFWGKPSILAGRSMYEELDCCYVPKTHEELIELIQTPLLPKKNIGAIKYGYWQATRGLPFKHYRPTGLFSGEFLGEYVASENRPVLRHFKKVKKYLLDIFSN